MTVSGGAALRDSWGVLQRGQGMTDLQTGLKQLQTSDVCDCLAVPVLGMQVANQKCKETV